MRIAIVAFGLVGVSCGGESKPLPEADSDADTDADADADADTDGDAHPDDAIFDPNVIATYDLEVDPTDWSWLNDNATLEEYVPATLVYEGQRWENAAVRYKGGYGALQSCFDAWGNQTCSKLSIKVSFNEYDPEGRFFDLKKLQFHSMNKDPSQMHERLAYDFFREMGVETARTAYALLNVNGEPQGLFVLVEQLDGRFTRRHFETEGGEGNLYKEVWPEHAEAQPYVDALQTNEDVGDVTKMVAFSNALAGATDETFLGVLGAWTDLDWVYAYLAVDRGISHWDGITAWYCIDANCLNHNYYWYEETAANRVWLVPWDMDHALTDSPWETWFGVPTWRETASCTPTTVVANVGVRAATCDPIIERLGRLGYDGYAAAAARFLDGPFQEAPVLAKIDSLEAQIEDLVAADPHGPGLSAWRTAVDTLRADIPHRRTVLTADAGL